MCFCAASVLTHQACFPRLPHIAASIFWGKGKWEAPRKDLGPGASLALVRPTGSITFLGLDFFICKMGVSVVASSQEG